MSPWLVFSFVIGYFLILLGVAYTTSRHSNNETFFIGNKKKSAESIFQKLKGSKDVSEKSILQLELMEIAKGLPINMNLLSCTLDELGENCKIITKELFKHLNLEK